MWVEAETKIVTDLSVDKGTLIKLGFTSLSQCSLSDVGSQPAERTNQQIMEYLKQVVPRMFRNSLAHLSTPEIQQFLDELTCRELWGGSPLSTWEGLLHRITRQTSVTAARGDSLHTWLAKVAADPFADWRYQPV